MDNEISLERVTGIEPVSSTWKADIMSHYTTPANMDTPLTLRVWPKQFSLALKKFQEIF